MALQYIYADVNCMWNKHHVSIYCCWGSKNNSDLHLDICIDDYKLLNLPATVAKG